LIIKKQPHSILILVKKLKIFIDFINYKYKLTIIKIVLMQGFFIIPERTHLSIPGDYILIIFPGSDRELGGSGLKKCLFLSHVFQL